MGRKADGMDRYKVICWPGEARTLYYVADTYAPEEEQPAIVATCTVFSEAARKAREANACPNGWAYA